MNHPESSLKTFGSSCELHLVNKVNSFCQKANRIDIIFDVYQENSLKNDTREIRGSGEGYLFDITHQFNIKNSKIF